MTEQETWLPVPGFEESYQVSNLGRVRSLDRVTRTRAGVPIRRKGRIMALTVHSHGYLHVRLSRESVVTTCLVHRLVAAAFIESPIPRGMDVCHSDGVRTNNALSNLRIDSHAENQRDKVNHGTSYCGSNHWRAKLTDQQVLSIRSDVRRHADIAADHGISASTISLVKSGKAWSHVP